MKNPLKRIFSRPIEPSVAARRMALAGVERRKARVRATVDAMRAEMGMAPARWPE